RQRQHAGRRDAAGMGRAACLDVALVERRTRRHDGAGWRLRLRPSLDRPVRRCGGARECDECERQNDCGRPLGARSSDERSDAEKGHGVRITPGGSYWLFWLTSMKSGFEKASVRIPHWFRLPSVSSASDWFVTVQVPGEQ